MSRAVLGAVGVLLFATVARGQLVVELVPDDPGPYYGGEELTVDVWLHSEVSEDFRIHILRLDFTDTDPAISAGPEFTFDLSTIGGSSIYYEVTPQLPVPWMWNGITCWCPENFLLVEAGGSFHVGTVELELPGETGVYRLDGLNRDEADPQLGGFVYGVYTPLLASWRASDGEITGGFYDFAIDVRPVPALSGWGAGVMVGIFIVAIPWIVRRRQHQNDPVDRSHSRGGHNAC